MSNNTSHNSRIMPWATAVCMVCGIAVIAAMYWNQNITVQNIKVNKLNYTDTEQIKLIAGPTVGIKPDSLNLDELVYQIKKLSYVKTVTPYVEPNGTLNFTITEREPLALLVSGKDRQYIDSDGVRLPILKGKSKNLPLLYGYSAHSATDTLKNDAFLQVRNFLLDARNNGFGWATISEIAFDEEDGVVALSHENGVKLLFGRNDFETKLENWEAFYAQVIRSKGISAVQQVDLRFTNQVITHEI